MMNQLDLLGKKSLACFKLKKSNYNKFHLYSRELTLRMDFCLKRRKRFKKCLLGWQIKGKYNR